MTIQEGLRPLAVPIDSLVPLPNNPRRGDVASVAASLERFTQRKPVVVRREDRVIVAGNHTWLAAKQLGWSEIAAVLVDEDETTSQAYALADNRTSELGGFDREALAELVESVGRVDPELLAAASFTSADLAELVGGEVTFGKTDPDAVPEAPTPTTKPGDLWLLGSHRVLCGDATRAEDVRLVVDDEQAHMVWTDPPYGVSYVGKTSEALTITNDNLSSSELAGLLRDSFRAFSEVLRPGGPFYVCSPSGPLETVFRLALLEVGLTLRQQLVWVKNVHVMGRQDYHLRHESVLYGWADGEPVEVPLEVAAEYEADHATLLYGWADGKAHEWHGGRRQNSVWEFAKPTSSKEHPTMKPVSLVEKAVANGTRIGGLVLDVFGGSGSTLIACEQLARKAAVVELDPRYVDVICRRWQEFTGNVPVLASSNEPHDFTR